MIQTLIVLAMIVGAAGYLGARGWRMLALARAPKDAPGCAGGCGCGDKH